MSAIRGLLFDYGGVIHDMRWDVARELEAAHGLPRQAVVETLYRTETWKAMQCGRGDRQAWLDEAHALLEARAGRALPRLHDAWRAAAPSSAIARGLCIAPGVLPGTVMDATSRFFGLKT